MLIKLSSVLHSTEFEHVFLLNPSSESTFAQYQSCRSSCPLQLLFWPNFRFQYEIWSFGLSNFDQKALKLGTVPPLFLPRRRRAEPARPAPLKLSTAVAIAKSDFASPFPFLARAEHAAELSSRRAAAGADSGHPSPPCLDSPRPESPDLTTHLLHPFPRADRPLFPAKSALHRRVRHCRSPGAPPPPSNPLFRPSSV